MIYILAFFLPPLALLLEGRIGALIVNLVLLVICIPLAFVFVLPGFVPSAHAIIVIYQARQRRQHEETLRAIRESGRDPRDFDRLRP